MHKWIKEINGCILRTCTGKQILGVCIFICPVMTASSFYMQGLSCMIQVSTFLLLLLGVCDLGETNLNTHQRPLPSPATLQRKVFGELASSLTDSSTKQTCSLHVLTWSGLMIICFVGWQQNNLLCVYFSNSSKKRDPFLFWHMYWTVVHSLLFAVVGNIKTRAFITEHFHNTLFISGVRLADRNVFLSCCERFWTAVPKAYSRAASCTAEGKHCHRKHLVFSTARTIMWRRAEGAAVVKWVVRQ